MRLVAALPARAVVILFFAWTLGVLGAAPASASCATNSPAPSPHAFLGTVIATSEGDRVAEVVTDDGVTVTVRGTQVTGVLANSYSSVDRHYAVGDRYEFHPLNGGSPYSDNDCTATRQVSGPPLSRSSGPEVSSQPRAGEGVLPAWLTVDEQAGPLGHVIFLGPVLVGALALFAVT